VESLFAGSLGRSPASQQQRRRSTYVRPFSFLPSTDPAALSTAAAAAALHAREKETVDVSEPWGTGQSGVLKFEIQSITSRWIGLWSRNRLICGSAPGPHAAIMA
jgi:hypothetical protein